ncbi:hypothetical protein UlMin_042132 [Ulmus minor]
MLDASAGGALLNKSYAEAYDLIESIAANSYQWPTSRINTTKKVAGVHELGDVSALTAQIASLTNMLKAVSTSNVVSQASLSSPVSAISPVVVEPSNSSVETVSCVFCGGGHVYDDCPNNPVSVNYVGNYNQGNYNSGSYNRGNNPYSNTFNPGWRQHPNFSWSTQTGQSSNNPNRPINPNASAPPGFQQQQGLRPQNPTQSAPQERGDSLEAMMRAFMSKTETHIQNQGAALRNLENQVGQLATALSSRPSGALPNLVQEESINQQVKNQQENKEVENSAEKSDADVSEVPQQIHQQRRPPPPFPQRFQKQQQDKKFQKFLDILKQLHINIPFVEALEQMPNYVKFMKDMLMKKRKFGEFETVGSAPPFVCIKYWWKTVARILLKRRGGSIQS